jgi:NAD(P)-dependent dehydrogenase (short-subunit alcohol dehydrogenase family)
MELIDASAVVTGAASGLGRATAEAIARRGARVIGIDLPASVETVRTGAGVTYVSADITKPDEVRAAIDLAAEMGPLRAIVNCAGVAPSARILSRDCVHDLDLFARVVNVNLVGTFNVLTLGSARIAESQADPDGQRGVIVNTASIAAYDGQIGQAAYASSKGGVVSLTLPVARDLARSGIRVCAIAPGIVDTPMMAGFSDEVRQALSAGVPFPQRLAKPSEYAQLVLSVIDNDYLNGEVIRMDGALRMAPR